MLELLQDAEAIERAWNRFHRGFVKASDHAEIATVGFPGGSIRDTVYQFFDLDFWYCQGLPDLPRFWNGFGTQNPRTGAAVSIDVEINFPKSGIDRRVAGAIAADPHSEHLWVVHRGKIGGGKRGVSKHAFWQLFRGETVSVIDGDRETVVALVAAIDSPRFVAQIGSFVAQVKRIKHIATTSGPASYPATEDVDDAETDAAAVFREEFAGTKHVPEKDEVTAKCDHGLVVNELAVRLEAEGYRVANDLHRDLFILGRQAKTTVLFEVKVALSLTNVHQALGQLMLHGRALDDATRLIIVVPEAPNEELRRRLDTLDVSVLSYTWQDNRPVFSDLARVVRGQKETP